MCSNLQNSEIKFQQRGLIGSPSRQTPHPSLAAIELFHSILGIRFVPHSEQTHANDIMPPPSQQASKPSKSPPPPLIQVGCGQKQNGNQCSVQYPAGKTNKERSAQSDERQESQRLQAIHEQKPESPYASRATKKQKEPQKSTSSIKADGSTYKSSSEEKENR